MVGFLPNFHGNIYLDITKNCLDCGDLDLIFKVIAVEKLKIHGGGTSVFSENTVLVSHILMLQMFQHILMKEVFQYFNLKVDTGANFDI